MREELAWAKHTSIVTDYGEDAAWSLKREALWVGPGMWKGERGRLLALGKEHMEGADLTEIGLRTKRDLSNYDLRGTNNHSLELSFVWKSLSASYPCVP